MKTFPPLRRVQAATGIEFRGHDLRRTAASRMAAAGVSRLVIAKVLDHAEPGVTAVYEDASRVVNFHRSR